MLSQILRCKFLVGFDSDHQCEFRKMLNKLYAPFTICFKYVSVRFFLATDTRSLVHTHRSKSPQIKRIEFTNYHFVRFFQSFRHQNYILLTCMALICPIRLEQAVRQSITVEKYFVSQVHYRKYIGKVVQKDHNVIRISS